MGETGGSPSVFYCNPANLCYNEEKGGVIYGKEAIK